MRCLGGVVNNLVDPKSLVKRVCDHIKLPLPNGQYSK